MKKIPTLFVRDPDNMKWVLDKINPACQWVADGEGVATRKYDGTAVLVDSDGSMWKRHEVKAGKRPPEGFREADHDEITGKRQGWLPVGDGPEDRWHREALDNIDRAFGANAHEHLPPGTYELCGPKIQGNPEKACEHQLVPHGADRLLDAPRTFDALADYLHRLVGMEGIVWHHEDGRMAKIKRRDFPRG